MAKPKEFVKQRPKRKRWRIWAFAAIVVVVLGAATVLLKSAFTPPSIPLALKTSATARVVTLQADMGGFSMASSSHETHAPSAPVVIKAKVGEPLMVRLVSLDNQFHTDGGGKHQFAIDELSVNVIAPPEGVAQTTFTPTKAGTYEFYCDI
ncbi:MAG: hypothetical protein A2Z21_07845, partial [Candidatus Fraserbacteria bacterium RBG_16_55_9]